METTLTAAIVPLSMDKPRRKRTLDDKACEVCEDKSTGKHYGVYVCDGCSGFFKRTVRRSIPWVCRNDGKCVVDRTSRTDCRACRFNKCLMVNMNPEGVQSVLGSRMSHDSTDSESDTNHSYPMNISSDLDQPGTIVQTVEGISRDNSSISCTSSSPPISMALAGGSVPKFQKKSDSPILIKVETTQCDTFVEVEKYSESRKESAPSSQVVRQPTSTKTGLSTVSQPVAPVVPLAQRGTQQSQLISAQMMVVPNTSFTHRYPYQSSHFPSTSPMTTPRYSFTDLQNRSPVRAEISHAPAGPQDSLHKMAVQLLSNSVQFAKNIPSFKSLAFRDQVILLEESWKDLFIIDAAFWSLPLEMPYIVPPGEANAPLVSSLRVLQELVTRIQSLKPDETECGYLKTVVIFKPDIKGLKDSQQIEKLQDEAQVKLSQYVRTKRVENPARFGRLLLTLLAFERVSQEMIEKLFFRAQNEGVEYILHDIFKKT